MKNIVKGSLSDVAQKTNQSLPMVLADIEAVVIVDVSYSMTDPCQNSTRYEIANQKLAELQEKYAGKVAVIQFSDRAELVPDGELKPLFESTNMVKALTVAHDYDDLGLKIIMISDGEPNEPQATLSYAKRFVSPIDTIFIGNERDVYGREFLKKLSAATGGNAIDKVGAQYLAESVETLLLTG